jgi:autotransporter translocation and assembly factor TamB
MSDADFKLASVIYPAYVASSAGKLSVMAGVSGTVRAPEIQGTVRLKDGMVRLAGREEVVNRIQLEGSFDQNQLTITSMTGAQGTKGKLTGSGTWQWGGLAGRAIPVAAGPPGKYQFKVNASNFTVTDRETYAMQLTGTFTIANGTTEDGRQMPFVSGTSTLSRGNLTLDLAATDQEEIVLPFYYDVSVDVPQGLFYRTVDSEVELQGTLRLLNKGQGNLALGTMTVRKGRYYLFTREIQNLTGDFIFNSLDRTDPELAVDGETTIPAAKGAQPTIIKVSLTGRASRPVVHLWDPNPDSRNTQADLWRMLTYGQFAPAQESGATDIGGNGSASGLSLPIQAYLFRNAERWLSQSGWIDTFDLGTGGRAGGEARTGPLDVGVVGAGKYVTRDLYINYSREFSGAEEKRIGAEYRVTRHLLLKGERTDRNATQGGRPPEEYNLDLKVRLEY